MVVVFRSLGSALDDFHAPCEVETTTWVFIQKNIPQNNSDKIDFFRPLIQKHISLYIEYNLHCTQLVHDMLDKEKYGNTQQLIDQIQKALMMAELLEQIYRTCYLNVPRKVKWLCLEQDVYRQWLIHQGYQFPVLMQNITTDGLDVDVTIRYLTSGMGWLRLSMLRFRQLLITIARVFRDLNQYSRWILRMEEFSRPIVVYVVCLFYIPRLFTELFFTVKHSIPHPWMTEQESALGWTARLRAQLSERWFHLTHDSLWLTCGIITCLVLTGTLAPLSIYVLCVMQMLDLVLVGIRGHIEIARLQEIKTAHEVMLQHDLSTGEFGQIVDYIRYLDNRMCHERKCLDVRMINNAILVLAIVLALPVIAFNPVLPLIGSLLAVLSTCVSFIALKLLEKKTPDKVPSVVSLGLFKHRPKLEEAQDYKLGDPQPSPQAGPG